MDGAARQPKYNDWADRMDGPARQFEYGDWADGMDGGLGVDGPNG